MERNSGKTQNTGVCRFEDRERWSAAVCCPLCSLLIFLIFRFSFLQQYEYVCGKAQHTDNKQHQKGTENCCLLLPVESGIEDLRDCTEVLSVVTSPLNPHLYR
jgi:hypothetical protein